ncbi:MAG: OsmC family protein [Chloroflexota bacterium]
MGQTKVSAQWTGEALHYMGVAGNGNKVQMGGAEGIPPTHMMLLGLAGCMGMDILSILQKKRQTVTDVSVDIVGHNADEYPKPYEIVELAFAVKGENVSERAVERAIELSAETYCIVGQTLQHKVELKTSFAVEA